jgi:hypothetical protein
MIIRATLLGALACCCSSPAAAAATNESTLRVTLAADGASVTVRDGKKVQTIRVGEHAGQWTLVYVDRGESYAVLEDFVHRDGHLRYVDARGVRLDLPKALESSAADPSTLLLGHTPQQVRDSATDLLGDEILATPGDPDYERVASVFAPMRKLSEGMYTFVGSTLTFDKVWLTYGGRSPNFDPVTWQPSIDAVVKSGNVWHGLVGGYLPAVRFVFPEADGAWTEMLVFAPDRLVNHNDRIQPVWYRVSRIEGGVLRWMRYLDTYQPFPPGDSVPAGLAARYYDELLQFKHRWDDTLREAMTIELPDARVANMARFGLVQSILTRFGDFPKYGAVDRNYGGSEHDGFPDTFNVETGAMLEWGLIDRAGRYIDNYFNYFVRDDGSLVYRGPEVGQFGRMLTVLAQYVDRGGDPALLLKHRARIQAMTQLLLTLRAKGLERAQEDPALGLISGWSEADASLEIDPPRYMQPYFSNSTESARGFHDLGVVWSRTGKRDADQALEEYGMKLVSEGAALESDIARSFARSEIEVDGHLVIPAIAGAKEPFHVAVQRDALDPQYRAYRAYMEMMYSGNLTPEQIGIVIDTRAKHHDVLLGVPAAYGYRTGVMAGFLTYGHGYGLIQADRIREALLLTYSHMAHQYTRGAWMAPETRPPIDNELAAPYATPAQLLASLMTRWLLVFEEPRADVLWLGKGIPRAWLEEGKVTRVRGATTRWGRVSFTITSHMRHGQITSDVELPDGFGAETRLRLRAPADAKLKSVTLNGEKWNRIEGVSETILIPAGTRGPIHIVARY